jgi:hypothetical protein
MESPQLDGSDYAKGDAGGMTHGSIGTPMKKLQSAQNLALATLWVDMLNAAGVAASVQRAYNCALVGQIPPDQALPEIWLHDEADLARARALLQAWQNPPEVRWACPGCLEVVEGPFEQCWNCGQERPQAPAPKPAGAA